jgi:hypothetical protein
MADGFEMIAAEQHDPFCVIYSAFQVFTFVLFATYFVSSSPCVVYTIHYMLKYNVALISVTLSDLNWPMMPLLY